MRRLFSRLKENRNTKVAMYPNQNTATARGTQRGIRGESLLGVELVCSVTMEAYLADDVPFLINLVAR
jgi:hypothetical protein